LNTAATVWSVAAIGAMIGLGRWPLALGATAMIVAANSFFHLLEHRVGRFASVEEDSAIETRD
jgi:uncharacterized membrane protein YhiD involved in acid resistance